MACGACCEHSLPGTAVVPGNIARGGTIWACAPTGCGCPPISLSPGIVVRDFVVRYGESILEYRSVAAVVAARGLQSDS
jgi:hypothetical protein